MPAPDGGADGAAPPGREREAGAEAITVCVRLRPLNELELYRQRDVAVWHAAPDGRTLRFDANAAGARAGVPSAYAFDAVFGPAAGNEAVYATAASPLVRSAMAGVNATLFAYGQTGSGKTHTIKAVLEAASAEVFDVIKNTPGREYLLRLSAVEIYNEVVRDLLTEETPALRLLDDPARGTVVEGAREEPVRSARHLRHLLSLLEPRRQVGDNGMHEASSRSHLVVRLTIESRPPDAAADADGGNADGAAAALPAAAARGALVATVNFVDLAGSERSSRTGAEGLRLKEGCHINRSLLTLGTVIRKLAEGAPGAHVPYRDSKLTRILAHALGGNGRTSVVCCMSPAAGAVEASRSALLFAENARRVMNYARVNESSPDDKVLLRQYQAEIAALRAQLAQKTAQGGPGSVLAALEQDFRAEQEARTRAERRLRGLELFILSAAPLLPPDDAARGRRRDVDGAERRGGRRERASWSPEPTPRRNPAARTPLARTTSLGASARRLFPGAFDADADADGESSDTDRSSDADGAAAGQRLPAPLAQEIHALEAAGGARGAEAGVALAAEMHCLRIHTVVGLSSSIEEAELVARLQEELARLSAERAAGAAADEATLEALRAEVARLRGRAQAERAADTTLDALQSKLAASQADLDRYAAALAEANARLAAEPPPRPATCEAACGDDVPAAGPGPGSEADAAAEEEPASPRSHRLTRTPEGASPGQWKGPRVLGGLLDTWHRREAVSPVPSPQPQPQPQPGSGGKENAPQPLAHGGNAAPRPPSGAHAAKPAACVASPAAAAPTGAWVPRADLESERERRAADMRKLQACFAEAVAEGAAMAGHLGALRDASQRAEWQKKRLMAQVLKLEFAAEEAGRNASALQEALAKEKVRRRREAARRRDAEDAAADAQHAAACARATAAAAVCAADRWSDAGALSPSSAAAADADALSDSWGGPPSAAWYMPKILRLWALLHIPLLHRSRFYLGFRGRETFYFEAEHRRLAWLQASARGAGRQHPLAAAPAALARERDDLARRLRKLAPEERQRLFARFGVDAAGKARKRQLAARLWSEPADAEHFGASAELVLRLHGLEPGQDLAVVFAPPSLGARGGLLTTA